MLSGIYKITNTINNKFYIGSSCNLKNREWQHFNQLKIFLATNFFGIIKNIQDFLT